MISVLDVVAVPARRIYTVGEISADTRYERFGRIVQTHEADGRSLEVPAIVPKLSATPERPRMLAPRLGGHWGHCLLVVTGQGGV